MFFSVFISPFVNFFLTFAIYLLGLSSSVTEALADPEQRPDPSQEPSLSCMIFKVIHCRHPELRQLQCSKPNLSTRVCGLPMRRSFLSSNILYALAYSAFLLIIAALVFDRREV